MLNQKLQLKLSQKLSPQQIQLMKLIQLSTLEFEQKLSREIEENPALDTTLNGFRSRIMSFSRIDLCIFCASWELNGHFLLIV